MPYSCSKETLVGRVFLNATKALTLLFLFFFHLFSSVFWYDHDSDYDSLSDEEEQDEEEEEHEDDKEEYEYYRNVQGDDFVCDHEMSSCDPDEWFNYPDKEVTVEDITGREDSYLDQDETSSDKKDSSSSSAAKGAQPIANKGSGEMKLSSDDEFLILAPSGAETKSSRKKSVCSPEGEGGWCTVGSSSSSSHWRSSITYRGDSAPDQDLLTSSYSVFHELKYDEGSIMLLDTTESLKSFQEEPRSIPQSFVEQLARRVSNSKPYDDELEWAYVAQVCLAWEILSWDYNSFRCRLSSPSRGQQAGAASDPGFPAQVAQQFQQFQVLLRRYIENEPYEYGKRPQVFARIKNNVAPKLLLVPQIRQDYEEKEDGGCSRISSASFLNILEQSIRTFMDFLKADKGSCCHDMTTTLFRTRKAATSIDPALLMRMKKTNRKKKVKVKKLQRAGKCIRRRKKVSKDEEMEMLMALIDLKVVARVLRMWDLTRQQLTWCQDKMTKLTLSKLGRLHRDSSPLFFPPRSNTHAFPVPPSVVLKSSLHTQYMS